MIVPSVQPGPYGGPQRPWPMMRPRPSLARPAASGAAGEGRRRWSGAGWSSAARAGGLLAEGLMDRRAWQWRPSAPSPSTVRALTGARLPRSPMASCLVWSGGHCGRRGLARRPRPAARSALARDADRSGSTSRAAPLNLQRAGCRAARSAAARRGRCRPHAGKRAALSVHLPALASSLPAGRGGQPMTCSRWPRPMTGDTPARLVCMSAPYSDMVVCMMAQSWAEIKNCSSRRSADDGAAGSTWKAWPGDRTFCVTLTSAMDAPGSCRRTWLVCSRSRRHLQRHLPSCAPGTVL